jgi:hypothetical protein
MNKLLFPTAFTICLIFSCSNPKQSDNADNTSNKISITTDSIESKKMIKQKITPCLWVETKDAKAVADYYLSIFKDGNLKEHRKYKNPPEAGWRRL